MFRCGCCGIASRDAPQGIWCPFCGKDVILRAETDVEEFMRRHGEDRLAGRIKLPDPKAAPVAERPKPVFPGAARRSPHEWDRAK